MLFHRLNFGPGGTAFPPPGFGSGGTALHVPGSGPGGAKGPMPGTGSEGAPPSGPPAGLSPAVGAPQKWQNFAPSSISFPHLMQNMTSYLLFFLFPAAFAQGAALPSSSRSTAPHRRSSSGWWWLHQIRLPPRPTNPSSQSSSRGT